MPARGRDLICAVGMCQGSAAVVWYKPVLRSNIICTQAGTRIPKEWIRAYI